MPLSPEAACLSFAHLLSLLFDARHLSLGGLSLQRDFVRYLGAGSTLLCLHFSPIQPYLVRMPPRQVQLLPDPELEWLQDEIKQLTEVGKACLRCFTWWWVEAVHTVPAWPWWEDGGWARTWTYKQVMAEQCDTFVELGSS